jgi:flagellar protein FliS
MNQEKITLQPDNVKDIEVVEMVVKLYDGAIDYLGKAMAASRANDFEKRDYYVNRANEIIVELDGNLNREESCSQFSRNLTMLYSFMNRHLCNACSTNNMKPVGDVKKMMAELRDSWQYICDTFRPSAA